jgi:ABC-2 type transport system ATP-binding protein
MPLELSIRELSKTYPNGVRALDEVSLTIPTGMFGLLGPNGAGKSTLMRIVATLQEPDSGAITLGEIDVLRSPGALRETLGYLPQEFGVYPRVSAEALLNHLAILKGIVRRGERRDTVEALLQRTNLWAVRTQKLGTFSGGMKQRFGIAQALIGSPSLLIVDEPTAGLDPAERNRFLNLMSEVSENVVVILSTHIVADVTDLCSRMAILDHGKVRLAGRPTEIIDRLHGQIWRRIVHRRELAELEASHQVIASHLHAGRTVAHVLAESDPGQGFERVEPRLEDAYFATLQGETRATAVSRGGGV